MIDEIRQNAKAEAEMARELLTFIGRLEAGRADEKTLIEGVIRSLTERIRILNSSLEGMIKSVSLVKKIPGKSKNTGMEKLSFRSSGKSIVLQRGDKEKFLNELSISESILKKLKKRKLSEEESVDKFKKANWYGRIANRFFLGFSENLLKKDSFKKLGMDIKKSNINFLATTYISVMFLSTVVAFLAGVVIFGLLLFFSFGLEIPFASMYQGGLLPRLLKTFWIVPGAPLVTFLLFYLYPSAEQKSIAKHIDSELPFAVMHMGSISGSGIEPTQIFRIVCLSREYMYTRFEIRKLINQINVYGYDVITALKNAASLSPSEKLAELFNGLSTTISSGGDLKIFFEKRAETLLLNYRLEREKFIKTAETFMDIYISVVIATPMILLLLLIMIAVSGISVGLSIGQLTFVVIAAVILINVLFLWIITMKQPSY